jgi:hypothetical protein
MAKKGQKMAKMAKNGIFENFEIVKFLRVKNER